MTDREVIEFIRGCRSASVLNEIRKAAREVLRYLNERDALDGAAKLRFMGPGTVVKVNDPRRGEREVTLTKVNRKRFLGFFNDDPFQKVWSIPANWISV